MADGILKVGTITTSSGSGTITLGQSGETVTIPSGATITNSGTATGFAGAMTPAFQAQGSGSQTLPSGTATKLTFATEVYDSDSKYDTSTSRFTPGEAGKFFLFLNSRFNADNGSTSSQQYEVRIYKNGAQQSPTMINGVYDVTAQIVTNNLSGIVTSSNSTDYFEIYAYLDGTNRAVYTSRIFGGYKIIE